MADPRFKARVRSTRIGVMIKHPRWKEAAKIYCHDWRLPVWGALSADQVKHIVYLPGAFADFAPDIPVTLLREAADRNIPLHVVAVDLPEYQASRLPAGWATRLARSDSFVEDARLLQAVLDKVVPEPHMLIGWSTGASQATILAALSPERTTALQLCMPAGFINQPVLTELVPHFVQTMLTTLVSPAQRKAVFADRMLQTNMELLGSLDKLPTILQMIRLLGQRNAVPYAARVHCPVVFVLGRHDIVFKPLIPLYESGELASFFPQAPSVTVNILEANHNGFATHQDEVASIALDTLATSAVAALPHRK